MRQHPAKLKTSPDPAAAAPAHPDVLQDFRWAALAAAAIVALSCAPYLFGWLLRPSDYMWHVYNADDANVHLSWMRQAAEGRWLFTDRFTSEPQQPQFTHLLFLLLGKIAGIFGGSYHALIAVYHLARVVSAWVLLVLVYVLAGCIYPDRETRRLALLAVGLSSGVGWWLRGLLGVSDGPGGGALAELLRTLPVWPEATTFLSLYIYPLFTVSLALLVGAYLLLLRAFETGSVKTAAGAGILALLLGQIHSYDIIPFYGVLAVAVAALGIARRAVPWREAGLAAVVVALSLPAPLYQYLVFHANPVFRQKALIPTPTPAPAHYLLTYGFVLLLAIAGAARLRRGGHRHAGFLVVWAVVTLAATYLPFSFQRKMVEGAHIPLAILAASAWAALGRRWGVPSAAWAAALVLLTIPSNLGIMANSAHRLVDNNAIGVAQQLPPYYLDEGERGALDRLKEAGRPEDVVLCFPVVGNYMPPYCGVTAYASHWAETINLGTKWRQVHEFLQSYVSDNWRRDFLRDQRIRFVFIGHVERALGNFDPARAHYLKPLFTSESASLYEVVP
ncbi:MAG: hypothetical protein HY321_00815 [Armatimonadetes bacterium]|nr:hypothetical protein [Armatimonadota bacterium]